MRPSTAPGRPLRGARPPVPTNLAAGRAGSMVVFRLAADPRPNARARRRPARHFAACAERRVYKPASFLILFKLACMCIGLAALLCL